MAPEPYEDDLRREMEGLDHLSRLFTAFIDMLEEAKQEYAEFLDPNLVTTIECMEYDAALTLNGEVEFEDVTVPGINKQLEDVSDQVQTFQAGLPTKEGIPDEG